MKRHWSHILTRFAYSIRGTISLRRLISLKKFLQNRVEVTGLRPSPLPHHRTCGSASGGSYQTPETGRDLSP